MEDIPSTPRADIGILDAGFLTAVLQHSTRRALIAFDRDGELMACNDRATELWTPTLRALLQPTLQSSFAQLREHPERSITCAHEDLEFRLLPVVHAGRTEGFILSLLPVQEIEPADDTSERVRWRYALENAEDGLWDWSADDTSAEGGRVYRSPRCLTMFGYPPDYLHDTVHAWSELVHPADLEMQKNAIGQHLAGNRSTYKVEYRIRDFHGQWRWVLDRGKVIEWATDGRPKRVVGTHTDITDYKDLELRLRERELLLDEAQRIGKIGSWVWDAASDIFTWSDELYRICGWPMDQRPPRWAEHAALFTPESYTRLTTMVEAAIKSNGSYQLDLDLVRPNGDRRHVEIAGEVMPRVDGHGLRLIGVVRDVTEERRATETARWRSKLLNRIAAMGRIGGFDLALATREFQWTDENYRIHGIEPGTPVTLDTQFEHYDDESRERLRLALKRMVAGESTDETAEVNFITPDQQRLTLRLTASVEMHEGRPYRITGLTQDITREREAGQRIEQLAHFDTLTGLPNRFLFRQRADEAISVAKRANLSLALLFVDLDRFKDVNDTHGHAAGDQLLQEISGRIKACVRGSDVVGRLGGDEFVVMLCEVRKPEDAALVADKIIAAVNEPVALPDGEVTVGASIGIALLNEGTVDLEALMRASDAAMYAAKQSGRNGYQYYNDAFYERIQRRVQLDKELRLALTRDQLFLVYQPTVALGSGTIQSFEALLRWRRGNGDLCSPVEFIPVAEESGEIVPIGRWVLREACRQAVVWRHTGLPFERIAVNVSAVQLRDPEYATQVLAICQETGWAPEHLVLELTESALMRDNEALRRTFTLLESYGVRLAVDDFGTGFSNLHYLHRFPVQHLKIDRSFVSQMLGDLQVTVLTQAIIHLGHALGLTVVAEGVETDQALQALRAQGCDEVQGYLLTPPLPPPELEAWVRARAGGDGLQGAA
ncbi:hypothetical protein N789_08145 [Arenimonas oryziterrae DSM 21050 = YC6267]|uniref:Histidine kinase n=1 Tax=Arenimonas oryziterrae DSM 21050 = YC6267 TaxID=1121015 RepID=A0A091AZ26_9GAMM|nr:hypothetical protein N789_08145 [Arenimonas oryziterrae DSM 21050 = YC6267]